MGGSSSKDKKKKEEEGKKKKEEEEKKKKEEEERKKKEEEKNKEKSGEESDSRRKKRKKKRKKRKDDRKSGKSGTDTEITSDSDVTKIEVKPSETPELPQISEVQHESVSEPVQQPIYQQPPPVQPPPPTVVQVPVQPDYNLPSNFYEPSPVPQASMSDAPVIPVNNVSKTRLETPLTSVNVPSRVSTARPGTEDLAQLQALQKISQDNDMVRQEMAAMVQANRDLQEEVSALKNRKNQVDRLVIEETLDAASADEIAQKWGKNRLS